MALPKPKKADQRPWFDGEALVYTDQNNATVISTYRSAWARCIWSSS